MVPGTKDLIMNGQSVRCYSACAFSYAYPGCVRGSCCEDILWQSEPFSEEFETLKDQMILEEQVGREGFVLVREAFG